MDCIRIAVALSPPYMILLRIYILKSYSILALDLF
jgi:hypothetical protein